MQAVAKLHFEKEWETATEMISFSDFFISLDRKQRNKKKMLPRTLFKDNITVCYLFFNSILIWYHLQLCTIYYPMDPGLSWNALFLSFSHSQSLLVFCVQFNFHFWYLIIYIGGLGLRLGDEIKAFSETVMHRGECVNASQPFRIVLAMLIVSSLVGFSLLGFAKGRIAEARHLFSLSRDVCKRGLDSHVRRITLEDRQRAIT